jgi:micrococcal nuclease
MGACCSSLATPKIITPESVPLVPHKNELVTCLTCTVHDGDTVQVVFRLGGKVPFRINVRLLGVDAPELKSTNANERRWAEKARDRLAQMVSAARLVQVRPKQWDKYGGRLLGDLLLDHQNAIVTLLSERLVRVYGGGTKKAVWTFE